MSRITVKNARDLSLQHWATWAQFQDDNPSLDSPFFCLGFTRAVAAVRGDVEVAIIEDHSGTIGFFPFHRNKANIAQPVCGRLSEFHGVVARQDCTWDPVELIRGCGLRAWAFDHLLASQEPFAGHSWGESDSPYIDLRQGFAGYRKERRRAKSSQLEQVIRKMRKIEREIGPLRYDMNCSDPEALLKLIDWKSQQYRRTRVLDIFQQKWVTDMLESLSRTSTDDFAGVLSALYVNDRIAAVHFGIRSKRALHWWFPAFDHEFKKYSPGLILLVKLLESAADGGIQRVDLGKSHERYKRSLMSDATALIEGAVDHRPLTRAVRLCWYTMKKLMRSSPPWTHVDAPLRLTRKLRQWIAFR